MYFSPSFMFVRVTPSICIILIHVWFFYLLCSMNKSEVQFTIFMLNYSRFRRGMGGLPSSRLLKGRGSVIPGDDTITDVDSVDGQYWDILIENSSLIFHFSFSGANEETEKWIPWPTSDSLCFTNSLEVSPCSSIVIWDLIALLVAIITLYYAF